MTLIKCPECNQETLQQMTSTEDVIIYSQCKVLDTLYTKCSNCGIEFTTYAQLVENDKALNLLNYTARNEGETK